MNGSSCLIWQIISFMLLPNEYGCVYAWTTLESRFAIDFQKMPILAKQIIFSDEAHFDLGEYVKKHNCRICRICLCIRLNNAGKLVCDRLTENSDFGLKIIFSDEPHLDLGGYINKQNDRIWGTENPHTCTEKSTHPKRVIVWCGFWSRGIIGPFFFGNEQGEAVTVNGDRYRAMLNEFLVTDKCYANWRFKGQYSWSHWWNTAAHNW